MDRFNAYILCTTPRSGSTMLCRLLTDSGVAGRPKSYFQDPFVFAWLQYPVLTNTQFDSQRSAVAAAFSDAKKLGQGNRDLFGLRLQGRSLKYLLSQLAILHPEKRNNLHRIESAFGATRFLYLTRENTLDQDASVVKNVSVSTARLSDSINQEWAARFRFEHPTL